MGAYIGLQWLEVLYFLGKKPGFQGDGRREHVVALSFIALSSILFGASTMLLSRKLGAWGDVSAAFLLCGTILNAVLTTIGCPISGLLLRAAVQFAVPARWPFHAGSVELGRVQRIHGREYMAALAEVEPQQSG